MSHESASVPSSAEISKLLQNGRMMLLSVGVSSARRGHCTVAKIILITKCPNRDGGNRLLFLSFCLRKLNFFSFVFFLSCEVYIFNFYAFLQIFVYQR